MAGRFVTDSVLSVELDDTRDAFLQTADALTKLQMDLAIDGSAVDVTQWKQVPKLRVGNRTWRDVSLAAKVRGISCVVTAGGFAWLALVIALPAREARERRIRVAVRVLCAVSVLHVLLLLNISFG